MTNVSCTSALTNILGLDTADMQ